MTDTLKQYLESSILTETDVHDFKKGMKVFIKSTHPDIKVFNGKVGHIMETAPDGLLEVHFGPKSGARVLGAAWIWVSHQDIRALKASSE